MTVTIEHLRIFKIAAETLNFTRAAEKCYLSQPALSRMMSALEEEWQVTLFDRTTRRVLLTPEGEKCLERVTAILKEYDRMLLEMRRSVSGELAIGFSPLSGPPEWFVTALKELRGDYPGVRFTLRQMRSSEAVFALRAGSLDCALIFEHSAALTEGLVTCPLVEIRRYAVVPRADPLAGREQLTPEMLAGRTLVFMKDYEEVTYSETMAALNRLGISVPEPILAANPTEMRIQVELTGGLGITGLNPTHIGGTRLAFVPLALPEDSGKPHCLALAWRAGSKNPVIAAFAERLTDKTRDL